MSDPNAQGPSFANENTDPPEDVATLYSWANLHGAKYRDFSASRAQAREAARQRVEEAAAAERRRQEEEAERLRQEEAQIAAREAAEAVEAARQAEAERLAELARQAEIERQAVLEAQEAQRQAAQQRAWQSGQSPSSMPSLWETAAMPPVVSRPPETSFPSSVISPLEQHVSTAPAFAEQPAPLSAPAPRTMDTRPLDMRPSETSHGENRPFPVATSNPAPLSGSAPFTPHREPPSFFSPPQAEDLPPSWLVPVHERETEPVRPSWLAPELPGAPSIGASGSFRDASPEPIHGSPRPSTPQRPVPIYAQPVGHTPSVGYTPLAQSQASAAAPQPTPPLTPYVLESGPQRGAGNRWFALKSVFDPQPAQAEQPVVQPQFAQTPVLAVFSLAGGVGKTSLVAALGRALSARGERILLVDTTAYGLLPFFFGASDQRPGQLRTFTPPGGGLEAPIQLINLDPETPPAELTANKPAANMTASVSQDRQSDRQPDSSQQEWLAPEITRLGRAVHRVLIDLPSASGSVTRRVLRLNPTVVVPVLADMNSVVSVGAIESFFRHNGVTGQRATDRQIQPYYLLNQFDPSLPLHLDVREILREQIGDRLLPFNLRRSAALSEALAEGMTVIDYAPSAPLAEDYASLAGWVRSLAAPVTQANRGVRWSER